MPIAYVTDLVCLWWSPGLLGWALGDWALVFARFVLVAVYSWDPGGP